MRGGVEVEVFKRAKSAFQLVGAGGGVYVSTPQVCFGCDRAVPKANPLPVAGFAPLRIINLPAVLSYSSLDEDFAGRATTAYRGLGRAAMTV